MANLMDLYMAFEKEERRREKKQDALEVEWLALDAQQEAKEQEAEEQVARDLENKEAERRDPEGKEAERKEINRVRRSAQAWEGAWAVAEKSKCKKVKRGKKSADNSEN